MSSLEIGDNKLTVKFTNEKSVVNNDNYQIDAGESASGTFCKPLKQTYGKTAVTSDVTGIRKKRLALKGDECEPEHDYEDGTK